MKRAYRTNLPVPVIMRLAIILRLATASADYYCFQDGEIEIEG